MDARRLEREVVARICRAIQVRLRSLDFSCSALEKLLEILGESLIWCMSIKDHSGHFMEAGLGHL